MTVPTTIDAGAWLGKYLEGPDGDGDLARAMLKSFAEAVMSAQASMQCGAGSFTYITPKTSRTPTPSPPPSAVSTAYDLVGADGGVFVFDAPGQSGGFYGS
ncbi:MAG: hypothetical protein M0Z42_24420, partial [Actinomycetota bacterium]|nr:hypothetical protein [Actinomycetota bacterium]